MRKYLFSILLLAAVEAVAAESTAKSTDAAIARPAAAQQATYSVQLLNNAKAAQSKLQSKQDYAVELKAIADSRKTVDAARLKTAMEFSRQQVALTDKSALEALEAKRRAVNDRFNELVRLIDQVEKNQKTELLPEKLNALIVFLEPAASETSEKEAVKAPPKTLSRGAAPAPQGLQKSKRLVRGIF